LIMPTLVGAEVCALAANEAPSRTEQNKKTRFFTVKPTPGMVDDSTAALGRRGVDV
jgi:hypothetical protein